MVEDDFKGSLIVIDDDPKVQQILEDMLGAAGYRVSGVGDGNMGLTVVEDELPDLVLLDIRLSDVDGLEICRSLKTRERTAAIPVIFISGLNDVEDKVRGFAAGGVDYITKPFAVEEILARVATHLTIARSRRQIEEQNALLEREILRAREAEEALRRAEEKHRFIAENVDDVIWQADSALHFSYMSASIERLGGYDPEEMTGKEVLSFLSGHSRAVIDASSKVWTTGKEHRRGSTLELELLTKDGTTIPIEVKFTRHMDASGKLLSYQGVARDIRDRKRSEQERLRLIAAIEHAAEAFCVVNAEGVVEYVNKAFCTESGYRKTQLVGKGIGLLLDESVERSVCEQISSSLAAGNTWSGRLSKKRKDGSVYEVEGSIVPIKDDSGNVTSYTAVARDITERLLLQEELQQSQKMEAMGALAGGIAHDFNNILAAIMGNAELALDDVPLDSPTHSNLEGVLKAGIRGRDLVKQILAFTRKTKTEKKRILLAPLIKETYDLLRASIPATIDMRLSIDAASDTVEADPVQIQQVLLNLATNAADAMEEKGGKMETRLFSLSLGEDDPKPEKGMQPGAYVVLSLRDTGCGMAEDVKRRVFEPFFSTKKPGRGTGMGLSVVYGIVKDLNGFITISSQPNAGSTFTVYLPKAKSLPRARTEGGGAIQKGRKERLLFVDDEDPIVQIGVRMLERLGYEVSAAQSGADALEMFARDPLAFDLVITDQTMPGITGTVLVEEMKKIRPDTLVILCSGRTDLMSSHQTRKLGIAAYVTKPFSREELAKAVQAVLGDRETPAETKTGQEKNGGSG
jgi:PAS domain S-box-containing protein